MRLLHTMAGAARGGAETFFVSLASALERARIQRSLALEQRAAIRENAARAAELRAAGVATRELPFRGLLDLGTRRGLAAEVRDFQPDLVLAFMSRAAARMPAGDFVKCARLGGYYDLKYYRRCDHLICNTPDIQRWVIDRGWPAARAHYLPNFARRDALPPLDRAAYDTPEGVPLLLALGRLHDNKGLDVLLRALAQVPEAFLWIAGAGPKRDALIRLAEELGVRPRVRFLGWREDRGALYRAADAVVVASRREPFGNVVAEAWAHGRPLVAADAVGPAQLINNGDDGLLVPRENADALAQALRRVTEESGLATRVAEAGYRRYRREFTEEVCVRRYLDLFGHLTGRRVGLCEDAS